MKSIYNILQDYESCKKQGFTESESYLRIQNDLIEICDQEGISALLEMVSEISERFLNKKEDAEIFSIGLLNIIAGGGYYFDEETSTLIEKFANKFPDSIILIEILGDVYGAIINQSQDDIYIEKLDKLAKTYPKIMNVALQQAYSLMYSDGKKETEEYKRAIEEIQSLYENFPQAKFAIVYADGLKKLTYKQSETEIVISLEKLEELMNRWDESSIAGAYLDALCKFTRKQDQIGCAETINKMEKLWDKWQYQPSILAMNLAYSLANYSLCFEGQEKQLIFDRMEKLSLHWDPAKRMADELKIGIAIYAHKPSKAG